MFEIIPNWHPAIVHFPIALLLTGAVSLWVSALLPDTEFNRQLRTAGHWNLRIGFIFAVIAAWFGLLAFIGVPHDEIAYKAKTLHRDWALVTVAVLIPFFILSCLRHRLTSHITHAFTIALIIPVLLILRTGWLGGEVVYRYGVGVERLTRTEIGGRRADEPGAEGPVSNTGDMIFPDKNFEKDTGVSDTGEHQD